MSINRWMDKENVVYTYNGILCSPSPGVFSLAPPSRALSPFPIRWSHSASERKVQETPGSGSFPTWHLRIGLSEWGSGTPIPPGRNRWPNPQTSLVPWTWISHVQQASFPPPWGFKSGEGQSAEKKGQISTLLGASLLIPQVKWIAPGSGITSILWFPIAVCVCYTHSKLSSTILSTK